VSTIKVTIHGAQNSLFCGKLYATSDFTKFQQAMSHTTVIVKVEKCTHDPNLVTIIKSRRGCVNAVTGTSHTSVDIGVRANLELVDKFCYSGNMYCIV